MFVGDRPLYPAESARLVRAHADELERLVLLVADVASWPGRRRPVAYHVVRFVDRVVALCLDADGYHEWSELAFLQVFFNDGTDLRDESRWIRETAARGVAKTERLLVSADRESMVDLADRVSSGVARGLKRGCLSEGERVVVYLRRDGMPRLDLSRHAPKPGQPASYGKLSGDLKPEQFGKPIVSSKFGTVP